MASVMVSTVVRTLTTVDVAVAVVRISLVLDTSFVVSVIRVDVSVIENRIVSVVVSVVVHVATINCILVEIVTEMLVEMAVEMLVWTATEVLVDVIQVVAVIKMMLTDKLLVVDA